MSVGRPAIDLTGQRFGRLVVLARDGKQGRGIYWRCRCDCGTETVVYGADLRSGCTRSCGCLRLEIRRRHRVSDEKVEGIAAALKAGEKPRLIADRFGVSTSLVTLIAQGYRNPEPVRRIA